MLRRRPALILTALLLFPALATAGEPRSISVAAAANMNPAFEEIAKFFHAKIPGVEQDGVIVRGTKQPALARDLVAFILGDLARQVLARYGNDLPGK